MKIDIKDKSRAYAWIRFGEGIRAGIWIGAEDQIRIEGRDLRGTAAGGGGR
ncbi:hypothetical protein [Bartonella queenslandensis]|uniref:hypothetical protein n=1 Tax=Bartonella queenslandensis TaxID=481138 RepID=UPI001BA65509|nr:hypothetical protein [Bartonella queenslandensis]